MNQHAKFWASIFKIDWVLLNLVYGSHFVFWQKMWMVIMNFHLAWKKWPQKIGSTKLLKWEMSKKIKLITILTKIIIIPTKMKRIKDAFITLFTLIFKIIRKKCKGCANSSSTACLYQLFPFLLIHTFQFHY